MVIEKNVYNTIWSYIPRDFAGKGFFLISILIFIIELSPIQDSIKNKFLKKSNQISIIFNACDNIKNFILN